MSDPTWATVFRALGAHLEISFGVGAGLLACALFVRLLSKRRSARHAALGLLVAALIQVCIGVAVRSTPVVTPSEESSPGRDALLAAAFHRVEIAMLAMVVLAFVAAILCFRRLSGFRFALLVVSLGVAGQALWLEAGVRSQLGLLARARDLREVERRAIATCLETPELHLARYPADGLVASVLAGARPELGVERVSIRMRRSFDSFPYHCLASATEVWCFAYSTPSTWPLEKLVRDHPFTSVARRMTDAAVMDWVAFGLGVYVWSPSSSRSVTDGQARPARVERTGSRIRLDFWERHPLIPGFGVQLRHTEVVLDGRTALVTRGPMTETLRPDWDRGSL